MGLPSPRPEDTASLLDPSIVDGLAGIMSKDELRGLLADVLADIGDRLDRISDAGALRRIQQDAHDVKSMSGNFGLTVLSARAAAIQKDARNGAEDAVRAAIPALIETGRASIGAMADRYTIDLGGRE